MYTYTVKDGVNMTITNIPTSFATSQPQQTSLLSTVSNIKGLQPLSFQPAFGVVKQNLNMGYAFEKTMMSQMKELKQSAFSVWSAAVPMTDYRSSYMNDLKSSDTATIKSDMDSLVSALNGALTATDTAKDKLTSGVKNAFSGTIGEFSDTLSQMGVSFSNNQLTVDSTKFDAYFNTMTSDKAYDLNKFTESVKFKAETITQSPVQTLEVKNPYEAQKFSVEQFAREQARLIYTNIQSALMKSLFDAVSFNQQA